MNIKKHHTIWLAAIALGAFAGTAVAGSITDTYNNGDTLTAAKMNNIKTAVNDNHTRITDLLNGTQTCATGMTRVGPTCIDTARQPPTSWLNAVGTCRGAGKRLPTAGELVAAHASGAITDLANDTAEHVDAVGSSATTGNDKMRTAYVGNCLSGLNCTTSGRLQSREDAEYDITYAHIYFRCAR